MSFWSKLFGGKSKEEKMLEGIFEKIYKFLNDDDMQNRTMPPFLKDKIYRGHYSYSPHAVGEYGRDPRNPVLCNGVVGEVTYLSGLVMAFDVDGKRKYESFTFHRLGSRDGIDIYEIISYDGYLYDILYLDMYYEHKSDVAPDGYAFRETVDAIRGTNELNEDFPYRQEQYASEWAKSHIGIPLYDKNINEMNFEQAERVINLVRATDGAMTFRWW